MAITALRLGSAPLTIDWSHLLLKPVTDPAALERKFQDTWETLKQRFSASDVGFYLTPEDPTLSQLPQVLELSERLLSSRRFQDCLILGIGGSALGPMSLLESLKDRMRPNNNDGPGTLRFHFLENPDPLEWQALIHKLNPETTLVCAITKSGTTFETMAQVLLALEWLGRKRWMTHLVTLTDPKAGDLRAFTQQEQIPTLIIPPSIGGRFSIFSSVGLFPAALAGLDVADFLEGAKRVRDFIEKAPPLKNPLFLMAQALLEQSEQRPVHIFMPYSTRLRLIGSWFVQLWGESLAKDGKGFTPVAALGATDQHSLLQLLSDGPDDKVTFFVTLDQVPEPTVIPQPFSLATAQTYPAFQLLSGHHLQQLLTIEQQATSLVLTRKQRPHCHFKLDQLNERSLGALYFATATLTAFTGTLWGVNPFDQPGVEEVKKYIREMLTGLRQTQQQQSATTPWSQSPEARLL